MLYIVSIVFLNGVAEYVGGGDTDSDVVDGLPCICSSLNNSVDSEGRDRLNDRNTDTLDGWSEEE